MTPKQIFYHRTSRGHLLVHKNDKLSNYPKNKPSLTLVNIWSKLSQTLVKTMWKASVHQNKLTAIIDQMIQVIQM